MCGPTANLENHIRGYHGNHAFSHNQYKFSFEKNLVSHFEGPIEQFGINLKGHGRVQDRSYLSLTLIVFT